MFTKQAEQQGLRFTGIYSHDKAEVKSRIGDERLKCPKARIVLVLEPSSKYSRGHHGMGYSAYADEVYSAYATIEHCKNLINAYKSCISAIDLDYKTALFAQNETHRKALESLQQAKIIIG